MTHKEHADRVRECLDDVEATHRAHGRAVKRLHKAIADYANDHGAAMDIGDENIVAAAGPKKPPPNEN